MGNTYPTRSNKFGDGIAMGFRCCCRAYTAIDELTLHFQEAHTRMPKQEEISDLTVYESWGLTRDECICSEVTLAG